MQKIDNTDDYLQIFLNDIPLMDVRAPIEFNKGAFPSATNIPLLDDTQREEIGKRYKDAGQDEAVELGLKLATDEIREQRHKNWHQHISVYPKGYLYCFRGGLRSRTTQQWLKEQGIDYPLVKGGYKAMRRFLIDQIEHTVEQTPFYILGGLTGSGKTRVLTQTAYHIDLEGIANHRGSAFGRDVNDFQPTQIDWENNLSIACLKYRQMNTSSGLLLEDEGKLIGRNVLPDSFYKKMLQAPRILLTRTTSERVEIILEDYISSSWPLYQSQYANNAEDIFRAYVLENLARIMKRLGSERYNHLYQIFSKALSLLFSKGDDSLFRDGIKILLLEYYDPMYEYQLQKKSVDIVFEGNETEVLEWVKTNLGSY